MPDAANQIGIVTIAHGTATAEGPEGIRTLNAESPVYADDVIKTVGHGSAVEIELRDGAMLSQGPDSSIVLDSYVYDPDQSMGEMTVKIIQGTLRSVTGEIVDMNPEGFRIESPLATIGIRGTTTGHVVPADGSPEQHVCVDFVDRAVVVSQDGGLRVITQDGMGVTATLAGLGEVAPAPADVLSNLDQLSSASMEQGAPTYDEAPSQEEDNDRHQDDGQQDAVAGEAQAETGEGETGQGEAPAQPMSLQPAGEETGGQVLPPPPATPMMAAMEQAAPVPVAPETGSGPELGASTSRTTLEETTGNTTPTQTSLDLSNETDNLTVDISTSPAYWEVTGNSASRTYVGDSIVTVTGSATGENTITGNNSDNLLKGGAGADSISGGLGDDTIFGNGGGDDLDGGTDNDTVSYSTLSAGVDLDLDAGTADYTISSTNYSDTLAGFENAAGSDYNDTLFGTTGDNVLWGNDGNDLLWGGGSGDDTLYGGAGDDTLKFHEDLTGVIDGGDDTDTFVVWTSSGNYDLTGLTSVTNVEAILFDTTNSSVTFQATDFDIFDGTTAFDVNTSGASSNDTLSIEASSANGETETIDLSAMTFGANWTAGSDKVILTGSLGNDVLTGSTENDSISGGVGNDLIKGNSGDDTLDGGVGTDTLSYQDATGGVTADLDGTVSDDGYGDTDSFSNFETFIGSENADVITTSDTATTNMTIQTKGGNDLINYVGNANNMAVTIDSGYGDDKLSLTADVEAGSSFEGCAGTDTLDASGNNTVDATELSVSSVEVLNVGGSTTTLQLSSGTISGQSWSTTVASGCTLEVLGSTSADSVNLAAISFASLAGSVSISTDTGNDSVAMGGNMSSSITVNGSTGDDTLSFTDTGLGTDELDNVSNVEHFVLGDAETSVTAVNALVSGGTTAYVDASAITSTHSFTWDGSGELDGSYHFSAGEGINDITGGIGNDTFSLSSDVAATSSFDGGAGTNQLSVDATISLEATATLSNLQELTLAEDVTLTVDWGKESFLSGLDDIYGHSGGGDETLSIVDSGTDNSLNLSSTPTFSDWSGNDAISVEGLDGNDTIVLWNQATTADGGDGNDNIFGGDGNDTLLGGLGDDYLRGENGTDSLTGGDGADTFHYQSTSECGDAISDFTHAEDVLQFTDTNFASLGTGTLNAANFAEVNDSAYLSDGQTGLSTNSEHFVYYNDGSTFALYYDADGSDGANHTLVATFDSDVSLTEADINLA
ncbi:hypothetical protein GM415_06030 [Pseudodesulfovibrio cashew]|uniref:FecR protein domain-containing protein n=1 Tax=Pseudodesulfovibrio cashew TaxID=2678688 RepID=A0A6I6JPX2_9BACT|nr:FecR domain-containing protein [Pseudodesulfovibrio cashew]QGY39694.1 hypothetical protein GM415_06030 [Pseudodesulfovibrio cashew]